jgi:glycosyltransferase involved in cell wall biosynthesis
MANVEVIAEGAVPVALEQRTADILIAIPTFNNEETIGAVLKAARTALLQFPQRKAVIVQADGGSNDSTMPRAKESLQGEACFSQVSYPLYPIHKLEMSHHSLPGKDSAYRTIFRLAEELNANACCIVDGDAVVTPDWIASLVEPVLETGYDLAVPFYQSRKYEGLLVNGILYPLIRALFGKRIRQPIGSDVGYSRALFRRFLSLDTWGESARRDVDLWINVQAMHHDMKICQVSLGSRRLRTPKDGQDVSSILANLIGAMYLEMEQTAESWQRVRGSIAVPVFGLRFNRDNGRQEVDTKPMIDAFRIGYENLQEIWSLVLPPATLLELRRMNRQAEHEFRFADELWARTIYDFAVAHRLRHIGRDHLLRALTPLYMAWIADFIRSVKDSDESQVESRIEQLCIAYELQKPYLISRWRWPDRFMP